MAVTKIWPVKNRLDHVLAYATDVDKVDESVYKELHNVLDYTKADFKTEKQFYVSGINCSPETAYDEMIITKKHYGKEKGIIAFHAIQSFAHGEVTPDTCHEIGMKLAEEMWGDRFEVIVSTHMDKKHLHNHFVINSVSFKDGKKYYDKRETYGELRNISDSLCKEYGLSVVVEKERKKYKINYQNFQNKYFNENNYYATTKKDIDRAIAMAFSYNDFENLLKAMNYEVKHRNNVLTIKRPPYKKNIRVPNYGDDYSDERIAERIKTEKAPRVPFLEVFNNNKFYRRYDYKREKPKGMYALYLHYCYLLNVIPKTKPYKKLPASIREDSRKLDRISNETKLLVSENLLTDEQFFLFKEQKIKKLNDLLEERERLYYESSKTSNKEEINNRLKTIRLEIAEIRRVIKLCDGIEERIPKIERNTNEFIEYERKESERSEHVK